MSAEQAIKTGMGHHQAGRLAEAEILYRECLKTDAQNPMLWHLLGALLGQTGRRAQAIEACREAVRLKPDFAEAHCNLANALVENQQWDEAQQHCQTAIQLKPALGMAHFVLGVALQGKNRPQEALAPYRQALRLMPANVKARNNLGLALGATGNWAEAISLYQAAIGLQKDFADAHLNLGAALQKTGRLDEAVASYQEAVRLRPVDKHARGNLCGALTDAGRIDEALQVYRAAVDQWPEDAHLHSAMLFALNYLPGSAPEHLASAVLWNQRHAAGLMGEPPANSRDPDRKLKVGYVSPDLCRHPVAQFLRPILAHHDRTQVEVFVYSTTPHPDAMTEALRALGWTWRDMPAVTDAALADQVRADQIDVLVDLAGHTVGNSLRAFARRPAPVQITYLGYCSTTGLAAMDYCLTDALLDGPNDEPLYTEKVLRLPGCFCCYWLPQDEREFVLEPGMSGALPVAQPPAARNGFLTFGSFHALRKLNDAALDVWSQILHAVPGSRMFVYRDTLGTREQERLRARFAQRGIDPQRLEMTQAWPAGRHYLARYDQIDIHLDTFPWSGHTTTCEALWMGVPTLTLMGDLHAGRMSATVLHAVGLADFVAHSPAECVDLARSWNTRIPELAQLRSTMRQRLAASALCDGPRFTRGLEHAYRQVWRAWCTR